MCLSSALCFFIILVFCILMHQLARLAASSRHSIPKRKSLCIRTIKHNLVNFLATGLEEVTFMRTALKRIRCAPKAKLHLEGQVVTITILDIAQKLAPQSRCKRIHEALVSSVPCWRSSQCGFFSYRWACLAEHVHRQHVKRFPLCLVEQVLMQHPPVVENAARTVAFRKKKVLFRVFVAWQQPKCDVTFCPLPNLVVSFLPHARLMSFLLSSFTLG